MATRTHFISASYIGTGLQGGTFNIYHTECGIGSNLIQYSGSTTITSSSLAEGLVLTLDESITALYLTPAFPISLECPLGCGYEYVLNLIIPTPHPSTPEPTPEPSTPEPSTPEPSTPEPTAPPIPTPEPSTPEPSATPTPEPTPEPSTPVPTPEPTTPEPSTPEPSTPQPTPEPSTPQPTPEPSTPAPSLPCIDYEVVNQSSSETAYFYYIDCTGEPVQTIPVPPDYDLYFCALEGKVFILQGNLSVYEAGPC